MYPRSDSDENSRTLSGWKYGDKPICFFADKYLIENFVGTSSKVLHRPCLYNGSGYLYFFSLKTSFLLYEHLRKKHLHKKCLPKKN